MFCFSRSFHWFQEAQSMRKRIDRYKLLRMSSMDKEKVPSFQREGLYFVLATSKFSSSFLHFSTNLIYNYFSMHTWLSVQFVRHQFKFEMRRKTKIMVLRNRKGIEDNDMTMTMGKEIFNKIYDEKFCFSKWFLTSFLLKFNFLIALC